MAAPVDAAGSGTFDGCDLEGWRGWLVFPRRLRGCKRIDGRGGAEQRRGRGNRPAAHCFCAFGGAGFFAVTSSRSATHSLWGIIGRRVKALRLRRHERGIVFGAGFGGDANDAIAVVVIQEISEGFFAGAKCGVVATVFETGVREREAHIG